MPDEDTGVPIELVAFDEHFGKFSGRLLNESLNLVESAFFLFVNLDVSISRFRVSRLDTDVYQFFGPGSKIQSFQHGFLECFRSHDKIVRWGYNHGSIRVDVHENMGGISDGRCRISSFFFYNELVFAYIR